MSWIRSGVRCDEHDDGGNARTESLGGVRDHHDRQGKVGRERVEDDRDHGGRRPAGRHTAGLSRRHLPEHGHDYPARAGYGARCFADCRLVSARRAHAGTIVHIHPDADTDGDNEAGTICGRRRGPDCRADGDACAIPEPDQVAVCNTFARADRNAHDHAGTCCDADTDTDTNRDTHANACADGYANTNARTHARTGRHAYARTYARTGRHAPTPVPTPEPTAEPTPTPTPEPVETTPTPTPEPTAEPTPTPEF